MPTSSHDFRIRLAARTGYSQSAIDAAWPEWWSDAAEASTSAQAELRFSVARKLGLDPRSLRDADEPKFIWDDSAKYKNFKGVESERKAITAFGTSVGQKLVAGTPAFIPIAGITALALRALCLKSQPFVDYRSLLSTVWALGIPTVHLQVHPLAAKHMCAMAVATGDRFAVLLAHNAKYPPFAMFHLAHELGHILHGHVESGSAVIDMDDPTVGASPSDADDEEKQADQFALELLTGVPELTIEKLGDGRSARQLTEAAMTVGAGLGIEPGMFALCYGHATKEWDVAQKALSLIYAQPVPVWEVTNRTAAMWLDWERLGDENESFLRAVMGGI